MTLTIPIWLIYMLGIIGVAVILFLAFLGILLLRIAKDFKINW
jgi:hypothetical protein